jgi:hypothetical protein
MKKLVISLAVICAVLIMAAIFLSGDGDGLLPSKSLPYGIALSEEGFNVKRLKLEDMLGAPFPDSTTDVDVAYYVLYELNISKITHWVIAKMSVDDFTEFARQLDLYNEPNLLEHWPEALQWYDSHPEHRYVKSWDLTNIVDANTYYGEGSTDEEYTAARYENGKLYLKKVVIYVKTKDESGNRHWEKAKKEDQTPLIGPRVGSEEM